MSAPRDGTASSPKLNRSASVSGPVRSSLSPSPHPSSPSSPGAGAGRYQLLATLGRGGMAEVFLAVAHGPRGFNKLVVLKRLRPHLAEDAAFREMFLDEARLAARLNHANVVQSYEVGAGQGSYFIAMEYLDGQPLDRLGSELRARGVRLDPAIAARIIADACSGLAHAHELRDYDGTPLQVIHRDVSPHNIFVTYDGQVKLVDFGIAKAVVSRAETEVGVLKGKIAYMAPEQAAGSAIDSRADLFAMGIVLWELIAGKPLFAGDNAVSTLRKLMNDPMPPPSSVLGDVDPRLEAIVMRALAKEPADRFQTARELREALEGWLRDAGRTVRGDDVGALVSSLFEGVRAQVQAEIQRHMAEVALAASESRPMSFSNIDQASASGASGEGFRPSLLDLGAPATAVASGLSRKITGSSAGRASGAPPGAARRNARLYAGAAGVAVAAVAIALLGRRCGAEAAAPVASVMAPQPFPPASGAVKPEGDGTPRLASSAPTAVPAPTANDAPSRAAHAEPRGHHTGHGHDARPSPPAAAPAPQVPAAAEVAQGFLTLDTYPWTRVSENGRVLGTTPLVRVALPAGAHVLTLDNPDLGVHQTYTATITGGATLVKSLGLK